MSEASAEAPKRRPHVGDHARLKYGGANVLVKSERRDGDRVIYTIQLGDKSTMQVDDDRLV